MRACRRRSKRCGGGIALAGNTSAAARLSGERNQGVLLPAGKIEFGNRASLHYGAKFVAIDGKFATP